MFRRATRLFASIDAKRPTTTRYFHRVTTNFISHDARGNLVNKSIEGFIGDPGESYVMIDPEVGNALRAARPHVSTSSSGAEAEERCKLTFFHDSQHFGHEPSSYPRLYIPGNLPRQTESNTSPATLFLTGKMHEIVLDGTPDANFAESSSETGRRLEGVFRQLEEM